MIDMDELISLVLSWELWITILNQLISRDVLFLWFLFHYLLPNSSVFIFHADRFHFPSRQILSEWFGRSVIRSCVKLSYDHAQSMIDAPDKLFTAEELPPCSPEHPIDEIHQAVLNLHSIARRLRSQRFEGGALRLDQVRQTLYCLANIDPIVWNPPKHETSKTVQSETALGNA